MVARLLLIHSLGVTHVIKMFVVSDWVILGRHLPRLCLKSWAKSRSSLHMIRYHICYVISEMVHALHYFRLMSKLLFRRVDIILREPFDWLTVMIWYLGRLQIIVVWLTILVLAYNLMTDCGISSVKTLVAIFTIERSKKLLNNLNLTSVSDVFLDGLSCFLWSWKSFYIHDM